MNYKIRVNKSQLLFIFSLTLILVTIATCVFNAFISTDNSNKEYATNYHDKEDELIEKVQQIKDKDTLVFALCTDVHGTNYPNTYTPSDRTSLTGSKGYSNYRQLADVITKLAEKTDVDFIANLGDTIASTTDESTNDFNHYENKKRFTEFTRLISNTYIPYLYTIGHHEMFKFNKDGNTKQEIIGTSLRHTRYLDIVYNTSDEDCAYYYVDFENPAYPSVRYISLDCCTDNSGAKYSNKEIEWLRDVALNTNKPVLVVGHMGTKAENSITTPENGELVSDILNNFSKNNGTVLAYIHGHVHCDNIITPRDSNDSYVDISTLCSWCYKPGDANHANLIGNPTTAVRKYNTYNEYAIDIYAVNCKTGVINIFRFGAGSDRKYIPQ